MNDIVDIRCGDCLDVLRTLPDQSVHCCVTSPPYFGLRIYGGELSIWGGDAGCEHRWQDGDRGLNSRHAVAMARGEEGTEKGGSANHRDYRIPESYCIDCGAWRGGLGLEPTPALYVEHLVEVFREVRRVLRDDGTLWLNLGDSYSSKKVGRLKHKDLVGIPWHVAFSLRADGWYLRQDIIWHKPNPMPESVTDRCTKAHEYVFLLTKSPRYYYDANAIREPIKPTSGKINGAPLRGPHVMKEGARRTEPRSYNVIKGANRRSVWTITTKPFKGAHFATFPPDLVEPCILAGCPEDGVVLDPFGGSGTTGMVAARHGRRSTLIELNPEYVEIMRARIAGGK